MLMNTAADIGRLVREKRRELGLAQHELATKIGTSRLWVIEFEKGKPRAEIGLVLRTLTALGLRVDIAPEGTSSQRAPAKSRAVMLDIDEVIRAAKRRSSK